jgi:hypothetical protein
MNDRVDLSVLELNHAQREQLVAAIMTRADAELTRRSLDDVGPMFVLSTWARPALAAAAALALLCTPVLLRDETSTIATETGLTDALAVPTPANAWLVNERGPTIGDVLVAIESEAR